MRPGTTGDLPSWLEIVHEVEDLFGPMPDFEAQAARAVQRGTALVVEVDGVVAGAALLSREGRPRAIQWLGVRCSMRGRGVGGLLVREIIDRRWPSETVSVVTFGADVDGGAPARRLYERHGFVDHGPTEPAPDGGSRDLYVLHR